MFRHVKNALAAGKTFETEASLVKYLNGLRGYLTRVGKVGRTTNATQARIVSLFRQGKLKADVSAK